jgi:hypothetical protein
MLKRVAVFALLSVVLVSAKSYTINLATDCMAGKTQLKSGEYVLKLAGQDAVLIDHSGHKIPLATKIETASGKYNETEIDTVKVNGYTNRIDQAWGQSRGISLQVTASPIHDLAEVLNTPIANGDRR